LEIKAMNKLPPAPVDGLTRRQSIQFAATGAVAGLLVSGQGASSADAKDIARGPTTAPFVSPLPVRLPKVAVSTLSPPSTSAVQPGSGECGRDPHQRRDDWPTERFHTLHVQQALHKFHPDLPASTVWGFDGVFPGPTFAERYGIPSIVRIYNDLPDASVGHGSPEIVTHLHNMHCGSESDGFTTNFYSSTKNGPTLDSPGRFKDHHYPHCYAGYDDPRYKTTNGDPREALGTLWYHDHREGFTAPNCARGLMGFYLMFDEIDSGNEIDMNPKALRLPSGVGTYDIPLMITDHLFDSSGYVQFDQFETDGILGNKICVNGKIQPKFAVQRRKYRFRLLDSSLSRFYELYLTDAAGVNQPLTYIANDGNLLPAPLPANFVHLGPAQRGDVVIDFARFPVGAKLYLVNRLIQTNGRGPEGALTNVRDTTGNLIAAGTQILRFDVSAEAPWVADPDNLGQLTRDPSRVPARLRELPPVNLAEAVKKRSFRFDRTNNIWTVNGKIFDFAVPAAVVKKNTAEIWTLEGHGSWHHPVHIHMEEFQILSRNGQPPPPHERGRKDVVVLAPGEVVRIFMRFRDFTGKYMMHCHNLTHEDHAMMIRFDVVE
jgi:FtsP/CotA-like multicopper oxidase with cupredoxin domain